MSGPAVQESGYCKTEKRPYKNCESCGEVNGNASKRCKVKECGFEFPRPQFDWEKLSRKGKTCTTDQRKKMEMRANVLHSQHNWDIVILCYSRHSRGESVYTYGTPGIGSQFIGSGTQPMSEHGEMALTLFKGFARDKMDTTTMEGTLTITPEDATSTANNIPPAVHDNTKSASTTTATPVTDTPTANNIPTTPNGNTSTVVAYVQGTNVLAVGLADSTRNTLHGHHIPTHSVCVHLTYVARNSIPAPVILGDPEENSVLAVGAYFALPKKVLFEKGRL